MSPRCGSLAACPRRIVVGTTIRDHSSPRGRQWQGSVSGRIAIKCFPRSPTLLYQRNEWLLQLHVTLGFWQQTLEGNEPYHIFLDDDIVVAANVATATTDLATAAQERVDN
eukprot:scaffold1697_cov180-Amphora_coffeaeformis.AAC.30